MPKQRSGSLDQIRQNGAFDVVVVGGGINGIGVYRELALQGLRVLLIERNDFCSGCSAAPSRMIHGGLRYLENGEFDLVRESLRERDALLENAPHFVRPLPTTIPIASVASGLFNGAAAFLGLSSKPSTRGAVPIKIGLLLYDWVTRKRRLLPRHSFHGAKETFRRWPELTRLLRFSAIYHDAWISHPERLGLELVTDVERLAPDSVALNYAEVRMEGAALSVTDAETGERMSITAATIVNATGAWLNEAIRELSANNTALETLISGTKGSHIILDHKVLHDALGGHMVYFENTDGRVCIVFPYLGKVLAGSTDIRVDAVERVRCEPEEQDYILQSLRLMFPGIPVSDSDVVFSYSGIRPLPKSDHSFTGRISRGHFVHRLDGPISQFCMVGGKWTTFRAFAEQTADAVMAELGHERRSGTLHLAIGGGTGFPSDPKGLIGDLADRYGVGRDRAAHVVDLYGTRAEEVLAFCATFNHDDPLGVQTPMTTGEVVFLIRNEHVVRLSDLILRRTPLAITGEISSALITEIAGIAASELGWDEAGMRDQMNAFITELNDFYGVTPMMLEQRSLERKATCA
uniref:glycerol-3-phosphate dehydrogenase/oxidase n=1 Tax=Hoeflea sp. TaxID=1940281 RepID=UPI0027319AF8|nr:glycerol-3-phosphate dehydrogenase/oxidase [Hoeflea sp.]MDP2118627.1 glycerol-3-phosphate dehydrogenase/oxidase [Hoeflea sp.]